MNFLRISCLSMAAAVTLGALGAHFLKARLSPDSLASWHTAVEYHVYHSLAMLVLAGSKRFNPLMVKLPLQLMLAGMIFFSGSIYLLSTKAITGFSVSWLGPITPVGGLLFIAAWLILAIRAGKLLLND
jgi:uncharacterized membrane protein YgdD (TMEM256/DUF423 family)